MPISIPEEYQEVPAWDRWIDILRTLYANALFSRKIQSDFKRFQCATSGFIIALWENENQQTPEWYLDRYANIRYASDYLEQGFNFGFDADWLKFGDPNASEDPKQWRTLKATLKAVDNLREHQRSRRIGIVYWTHPDSDHRPEDIYLLMDGYQFPGSPTQ